MNSALKQRLVGATVIVALGVIFVPMLLERGAEDSRLSVRMEIPPQPRLSGSDTLDNPPEIKPVKPLVPIDQAIAEAKPKQPEKTTTATTAKPESAPEKPVSVQKPVKAVKKPDIKSGDWLVQVGSFGREENARQLKKKLEDKGYDAYLESAKSSVGPIFRVRIGPQASRADAEKLVGKLSKQDGFRAIVLANE